MTETLQPDDPSEQDTLDIRVRAALIAHLYRNSTLGIVSTSVAAVLVALALYGIVPDALLGGWLACVVGLSAARLVHVRRFPRSGLRGTTDIARWYRHHLFPTSLSASLWGVGIWIVGPYTSTENQLLFVLVVAGSAAGALPVLGAVISEFLAYVALSIGPTAVWFALHPPGSGQFLTVFIAIFLLVVGVVGVRQGRVLADSFRLAHENARLVDQLRGAADTIGRSNRSLAAREAQLRRIIDLVPYPIYAKRHDGRFVLANEATARAHGTTVERLVGAGPDDLGIDPDELAARLHEDRRIIDTGEPVTHREQTFTEPGGRQRTSRTTKTQLIDATSGEALVLGVSIDITDLKDAEREAVRHKSLFEAILQNLPVCIYRRVRHPDGTLSFPFISTSEFGTFRYDAVRYMGVGDTFLETIHPEDREAWRVAVEASAANLDTFDHEFRIREESGTVRWVRGLARPRAEDDGTVIWDGIEFDVTERRQVESALLESEERFRSAFDNAPVGMALIRPDRTVLRINHTLCEMLGYDESEMLGRSINDVTHPEDVEPSDTGHQTVFAGGRDGYSLEKRYLHKSGRVIWAVINVTPVHEDDGSTPHAIAQVQDITESRRLSEELSYQATHDGLTGLVNRAEFEKRLDRVIVTAARDTSENALCYLDLDQFKVINDTCGHIAGDELLRQIAGIVGARVRHRDTVARLGGDEFAVLMEHCGVDQASRVADQVREAVAAYRFQWEGKSFSVGTSIGVVPIDSASASVTEVLRAADAACYAAKDQGRNRIHLYRDDDAALAQRRGEMQWVERLGRAIDEDRLRLMAQPIVSLDESDAPLAEHVEVLLRLEDESGALVPPGAFLPAAERYNMAERIDRWVVESALARVADAAARGHAPSFVAINLSGQSVGSESFRVFLAECLGTYAEIARRICFEITETAAITHLAGAAMFMHETKALGCSFALDDFGSGLSSFGYLKNLPVDYLKIDGAFVKDIMDDRMSLAIVRSINDIGHVLGKHTIAEFVESDAIRERLADLGVDYAQGYGIGRPVPIGDLVGAPSALKT